MKNSILTLSMIVSLLVVACSEENPSAIQKDILNGADSPGLVLSKANNSAAGLVTTAGVFSSFGVDATGTMECVMNVDPVTTDRSEFHMTSHSNANNVITTKRKQVQGSANIIVSYVGFTAEAQAAFQSAVDIWAKRLNSDVDIFVLARFLPLGPGVLGSAGSTFILRDFAGAQRDTWYGNALGDKLAGEDLVPGFFDIVANFSSAFPNWYFGLDGNTPSGDFDFRTVVLHELGHGLNFFGGMTYDSGTGMGSYGFGLSPTLPTIYDRFANTRPGRQLVKTNKFPNPSTVLGDALIGEQILFSGSNTISKTQGDRATLFTPDAWRQGSSYSHLDEVIYSGTVDGLMTPFLAPGESYIDPGPIVLSMFDDMGWNGKIVKPFK